MGIAEMRRNFAAYGSGQLPEMKLRKMIRSELSREPKLGQEFIALTDACRRENLIGSRLQSHINADILEITSPNFDLTEIRAGGPEPDWVDATLFEGEVAANATVIAPTLVIAPSSPRTDPASTGSWNFTDSANQPSAPLQLGDVLRERFVLEEELGRGGMGVVYKAFDRSRGEVKDRHVAIKVLSEKFKRHPLAVMSLQREARKAQKLAHPNIVAVHDFDRDGGNVFMVMELLSGRSLDRVLREDGARGIPLGPALQIIRSLAAALSYAHEHDIIHCDFKPGNAFLGRDGRVKVLDFGIARAAPTTVTDNAEPTLFDAGLLGAVSPAYASCEMLRRESPDVRDDVYSFACVVYELLSGAHPFQRIDAIKAFQSGLEPRPIPKLSRTQWRALKQGLALSRAERCPSIDALAGPCWRRDPRRSCGRWAVRPLPPWPSWQGLWSGISIGSTTLPRQLPRLWRCLRQRRTIMARRLRRQSHRRRLPPCLRPLPSHLPRNLQWSSPPRIGRRRSLRCPKAPLDSRAREHRQIELEGLQEQFENQAIAGDVEAAVKAGAAVVQAAPGALTP